MARAKKGKANKGSLKVNFKGVESRQTPPEGDYVVEVLEAQMGVSGNKNDQVEFTLEIAKGKYKGVKLYLYCTTDEKSLWKLHAFLTALGVEVPDDEMDLDLADLVGEQCVGVVMHETYNGKKRAKMTDFDSLDNYSGDDDDEDEDDKKSSKKSKSKGDDKKSKKSKKDDDDEDEDEDDEDDKKSSKKSKSKKPSKKSAKDDDEDEDDEPKKKGKGKKKPKKLDRSDVEDMDEDELQELIDEHDLDVDLDDFKKLPKKVAAVLEALEEEDLVDEEDD